MKQKILLAVSLALMVTIFSGCTSATMGIHPDEDYVNIPNSDKNVAISLIGGSTQGIASISRARDARASAHLVFQIAADYTLAQGDKYFSVYKPEMISNFSGSPINTMEKFDRKCSSSVLGSIGSTFDGFGLNTYACRVDVSKREKTGFLYIAVFDKKPKSLLVWDAQKVIDYLKKHNEYRKKDKFDIEPFKYNARYGYVFDALPRWRVYDMNAKE